MPLSWVRTFTDADDFGAAMRTSHTTFNVTESGNYRACLTGAALHSLYIQQISDNLARTFHTELAADCAYLMFETRPGPARVLNRTELTAATVMRAAGGHAYFGRSLSAGALGFMSLPRSEAIAVGAALGGRDMRPPADILFARPEPDVLAKLRRLYDAAITLVRDAPEVVSHSEAARGLEQALIDAMVRCVSGEPQVDRAATRQHAVIMRRFRRVIEEHLDQPLYIPELCKEIGTTGRTLNLCCHEHLGMGAKHFLLLRRMHMVKRSLRQSSPRETTVTEIATRYGFWQFGRLAVEYRALFGEAPSATLARPA
jgi:AraC-like DNA-binding protein